MSKLNQLTYEEAKALIATNDADTIALLVETLEHQAKLASKGLDDDFIAIKGGAKIVLVDGKPVAKPKADNFDLNSVKLFPALLLEKQESGKSYVMQEYETRQAMAECLYALKHNTEVVPVECCRNIAGASRYFGIVAYLKIEAHDIEMAKCTSKVETAVPEMRERRNQSSLQNWLNNQHAYDFKLVPLTEEQKAHYDKFEEIRKKTQMQKAR